MVSVPKFIITKKQF